MADGQGPQAVSSPREQTEGIATAEENATLPADPHALHHSATRGEVVEADEDTTNARLNEMSSLPPAPGLPQRPSFDAPVYSMQQMASMHGPTSAAAAGLPYQTPQLSASISPPAANAQFGVPNVPYGAASSPPGINAPYGTAAPSYGIVAPSYGTAAPSYGAPRPTANFNGFQGNPSLPYYQSQSPTNFTAPYGAPAPQYGFSNSPYNTHGPYGAPTTPYGAPGTPYGPPNSAYGAINPPYGAPNSAYDGLSPPHPTSEPAYGVETTQHDRSTHAAEYDKSEMSRSVDELIEQGRRNAEAASRVRPIGWEPGDPPPTQSVPPPEIHGATREDPDGGEAAGVTDTGKARKKERVVEERRVYKDNYFTPEENYLLRKVGWIVNSMPSSGTQVKRGEITEGVTGAVDDAMES